MKVATMKLPATIQRM